MSRLIGTKNILAKINGKAAEAEAKAQAAAEKKAADEAAKAAEAEAKAQAAAK